MSIYEGSLVTLKHINNRRGYRATGRVVASDGRYAIVEVYGLDGPGSKTEVNDVPLHDLEEIEE